ncbi:AidA/PixA family protein [Vitiosangium sp. GDMCC 1.1324]|uniref:AidA/PixA family protein n=1 Tax=Vitiosangium sp. (strain GDMCC 1.1324) TaxID=2138576 RepID=UPI000D390C9F|nr:AidA/PixA family protein [Vitiosangium sp. GDMCC 1.1324]PTL80271.1 hypothetical protein DAT35_30240 [Vitiosangium sp. GDMCC 1.1324]
MASNDPFIDILTVIDAKSIVSDYSPNQSTSGSPISLGNRANQYVFMLVKRSEAANGIEAIPELNVAAQTGDILRWRTSSLTMNTGYSTLLYQMRLQNNGSPGNELITIPAPYEGSIKIPKPAPDGNGVSIGSQPYKDFYFQSTAQRPGKVTYQLYFMLADNQGKPFGYFYWDPFVTITQS